jgi:hypothetical protein
VASGLTLDSGALIAAEKGSRRFWTFWKDALERNVSVTVPTPVLAQVWRGNSAVVARVMKGCEIDVLTAAMAKLTGQLLAASRTSDIVDAAVVIGAAARRDAILTSDPDDIGRLVAVVGRPIVVLSV